MFTKSNPSVHIQVTLEDDKFIATDIHSSRDRFGKHGKVEIYKVSTTMSALHDPNPSLWASGYRLRSDGSVGSRHTTSVLLDNAQVPQEVMRAIRLEYVRVVRAMVAEAATQDLP